MRIPNPIIIGNFLIRYVKKVIRRVRDNIQFKKEFLLFKYLSDKTDPRFDIKWRDRYPCFSDMTVETAFDRHYVFHTAWAARIIASNRPIEHVDISSLLYFVVLISAFVPVRFYDYRPVDLGLDNLVSGKADLLNLPFSDGSIQSLSCMHVVEHLGLGRYGDPIDPDGDIKAIKEIKRVMACGGDLLFVVPIGQPRVLFNAHRIYSYEQIMDMFNDLELINFSLIPDNPRDGGLIDMASKELADSQSYGCGCFWFRVSSEA